MKFLEAFYLEVVKNLVTKQKPPEGNVHTIELGKIVNAEVKTKINKAILNLFIDK